LGAGRLWSKIMENMGIPVVELGRDKFRIAIDTSLYAKEAVTAVAYKYSAAFHIYQERDEERADIVNVTFEPKDGGTVAETTPKDFCNELLDQQLRLDTEARFGKIRDMIVEEAFKPVAK